MATSFGLTPTGFVPMQQADIVSALQKSFQQSFGINVNLAPESINSQLISIFAEREALVWQLAEAVYNSQFPGGAEGTSVDNILALNNLKRLPATATKTNPEPLVQANQVTLYGLALYGTPGTIIPSGSLMSNGAAPAITFALDTDVTIGNAANAQQQLVFSNTPNSGSFALNLTAPSGLTLTTPAIAYNAQVNRAVLSWMVQPTSGIYAIALSSLGVFGVTAPISVNSSAATVQTAIQGLSGYSGVTVSGSQAAGFTFNFPFGTNPILSINSDILTFASPPTNGNYTLSVGGEPTINLDYTATAADVQAAIRAIPSYETVNVTGDSTSGFHVIWNYVIPAAIATVVNTTGYALSSNSSYSLDHPGSIINSVQAQINNLFDVGNQVQPFTDVQVVTASPGYRVLFGAMTPQGSSPFSGIKPQPLIVVISNSLQSGSTITNVNVINTTIGTPAKGIGTATATATGPNFVGANTLTTIVSPLGGWTGVVNQLDCLSGTSLETDTDALLRRTALLASQANGPLQSIVEKVLQVSGVTAALGFQNLSNAALQTISFATTPSTGSFKLVLSTGITTTIAYNANANAVQTAINNVAGFALARVTGSITASTGLTVDFNGAQGGQYENLLTVSNNTTGTTIAVAFGRPPHSYEIVVQGGSNQDIAKVIYDTAPAGITSYSSPVWTTTGSVTSGGDALTVNSSGGGLIEVGQNVVGYGIPNGTFITADNGGLSYTMSLPAQATGSGVALVFNYTTQILDAFGNPVLVSFSRPKQVTIYMTLSLTTDLYNIPGDVTSGSNPYAKFNPQSIATIQQDLIDIANAVPIGGLIIGMGTNGLIGAFNNVPGIIDYDLFFDRNPTPSTSTNIQLLTEEIALAQTFNTQVSYT